MKGNTRRASVLTAEVVGAALQAIISPRKMCTMQTQQNETSTSTAWEICHDGLPLSPYRMQLSQPLSETEQRRVTLCEGVRNATEDNPGVLDVTWSSDEA